jgi:RNA polymerase sigma factor (sigma-70 family)
MESNHLKDDVLIKRFVEEGDQSGIEVLINRYKSKVYTYIYFSVRNHNLAEDIFQETFIKAIGSLKKKKYSEKGTFQSWVTRIAHNLIVDYFRKNNHLCTISTDAPNIHVLNAKRYSEDAYDEVVIKEQIRNDVKSLIEFLPEEQQEVVLLRHYGGMSFKEIAEVTNVSANTALGRMRYALITLRKIIAAKNIVLTTT